MTHSNRDGELVMVFYFLVVRPKEIYFFRLRKRRGNKPLLYSLALGSLFFEIERKKKRVLPLVLYLCVCIQEDAKETSCSIAVVKLFGRAWGKVKNTNKKKKLLYKERRKKNALKFLLSIFPFLCMCCEMCCTPCDLWFKWLWVSGSAHTDLLFFILLLLTSSCRV